VWPLRPLFGDAARRRPMARAVVDHLLRPWEGRRLVPPLAVEREGAAPSGALPVDERVLRDPDRSPALVLAGPWAGAELELALYTESGYDPARFGPLAGEGPWRVSLREALRADSFRLADALIQTADFDATRAYLEVRIVRDGELVAASEWIELAWEPGLLELLR
jgi:hypothetical protein